MPAKKKTKSPAVTKVINEAIHILEACGLPMSERSIRGREKTAMAFLAVAGVTHSASWSSAGEHGPMGTRKIIAFVNQHFGEAISLGSYDDIRRKDLADALLAELIIPSAGNPTASVNDPTRGYAMDPALKLLVRKFGQVGWQSQAADFMAHRPSLADLLKQKAQFEPVPLILPNGTSISLSSGPHNILQKAVVEQFLPRFGSDCQVVYIGDTAQKTLYVNEELASAIGLVIDPAAKIPDVIAYSPGKKWLFLIEAVHSFGPISNQRRMVLEQFAVNAKAGLVFVTTFLNIKAFRKASADIGWDTEVWIATEPDHLIHWNGDRFLGPRPKQEPT